MDIKCDVLLTVPGVMHGFGTQHTPIFQDILPFWEKSAPQWKQVHGSVSAKVTHMKQDCGEVDALYTFQTQLPIAAKTADCVPILMARKDGQAIAAVHAGWRGARAHILKEIWNQLKADDESPEDWVAAVGPAIGPCCFEVSEELVQDFLTEFAAFDPHLVAPAFRKLDLPAIEAEELKSLGVPEVEIIRRCTQCSRNPIFSSYRRDHGQDRQYSVICRV